MGYTFGLVIILVVFGLAALIWNIAGRKGWVTQSFARMASTLHLLDILLVSAFALSVYLVYLVVG